MVMFTLYQTQPLSPAFYKRSCKPLQNNFSPLSCICRSPPSKLIWVFSVNFKKCYSKAYWARRIDNCGNLIWNPFRVPELSGIGRFWERFPKLVTLLGRGWQFIRGSALGQPLPRMIQTISRFCAWKCQCWWNFSKTNCFFAKPNSPAKLLDNQPVATNVMTYFLRK